MAALTLPAAALWFATVAVLAGDPVDYVSPESAAPGGGGTQLMEQRLRGATGTPGAVVPSGSQRATPSPSPAGPRAAPSQPVAPGIVVAAPTAAAPSGAPSPSVALPTLPAIVPARSASPSPTTPPLSPPPTASPSLQPTSPPSIEPTSTPVATPAARLGDCADGIDNDGDALVDLLDPGCLLGLLDDEAAFL